MQKRPLEAERCALADADSSAFLLIDVQEKLLPAISRGPGLVDRCLFLLNCCQLFDVPAVVSEQYPRGLGATVPALSTHSAIVHRFEKLHFSAAAAFLALSQASADASSMSSQQHVVPSLSSRKQVILAGIESHICVLQTALELRAAGLQVFVCADATGSRAELDREIALRRLEQAGCVIATAESIAFEWCHAAGTDSFRKLSQLVKNHRS